MTAPLIFICVTSFIIPIVVYRRGYERGHAEGYDLGAATGFVRGRRSEREETRNLNF